MALMDRLLRFGEGKLLKQLSNIAKQVHAIEDDFVATRSSAARLRNSGRAMTRVRRSSRCCLRRSRRYAKQAAASWISGTSTFR